VEGKFIGLFILSQQQQLRKKVIFSSFPGFLTAEYIFAASLVVGGRKAFPQY